MKLAVLCSHHFHDIWGEEGVAFKLCYGHAKVGNLIPTAKYYRMQ